MKIILFLIFGVCCSVCCYAQKGSYKIRVVHEKTKTRGVFFRAEDDGLTVIKNSGDTIKIAADGIRSLYIHKRGIVAPVTVAAAIASFALLFRSGNNSLENFVAIYAGVPIGTALGLFGGDLLANKRYYTRLEAKDFPVIKADLQKYTLTK